MKNIITSIILFSSLAINAQVHIAPMQTKTLQNALANAQQIIKDYFKTASAHDKHVFSEYLQNYRSAGGYQAVTPASPEILKAVQDNPTIQTIFNKIKELAQQFTQTKTTMPGASSLTPEGDVFYATLIQFTNQLLANK